MIRIHEIIKIIEEIGIDEIVGMEDPITETIDEITEVEKTAMTETGVEVIVEIITVETEDRIHRIATGHGVREVPQEGEIIIDTIEPDMTDIEDDLVKAREEKKNDIITKIVIKRTTNRNSNSHGNGWHLTKKET